MEILQSQTNLNKPVNDLHTEEKQDSNNVFHAMCWFLFGIFQF